MKTLIVYYSFEGNTEFIAKELQRVTDADLCALKPEAEIKSHGFTKYFWGGMRVMMKKEPELINVVPSMDDYDLIILGSPVWAFTYSPAMRTFLKKYGAQLQRKKVACYCCHKGGPGKTLANYKSALKDSQFIGETTFFEPNDENPPKVREKVEKWAEELQAQFEQEPPKNSAE